MATDGDETVLVAVISAYEEGSARMPEPSVGAVELATMSARACSISRTTVTWTRYGTTWSQSS